MLRMLASRRMLGLQLTWLAGRKGHSPTAWWEVEIFSSHFPLPKKGLESSMFGLHNSFLFQYCTSLNKTEIDLLK